MFFIYKYLHPVYPHTQNWRRFFSTHHITFSATHICEKEKIKQIHHTTERKRREQKPLQEMNKQRKEQQCRHSTLHSCRFCQCISKGLELHQE